MEIVEEKVKVMDTSRITIVRSTANNKAITVDGYLYHYEDQGLNTIRWICKFKGQNCRARLITTPVVGDDTSHVVVRIDGSHKCVKTETTKPSPVEEEEEEEEIEYKYTPKKSRAKTFERQQQKSVTSDEEYEDDYSDGVAQHVEYDEDEEDEDEEQANTKVKKATNRKKQEKAMIGGFKTLSKFERNKVYILRTNHNRELVLVDGFLYRLEGKSKTSATFRWECIRSDINCKTRIYTERLSETKHSLKHLAGNQTIHGHPPYTPDKISELLKRHKITLLVDETKTKAKEQPDYTNKIPHYALASKGSDPLIVKRKSAEQSTSNNQIILLPSINGNQVLCVNKMIYHYDSKSRLPGRSFWTCQYRHHKQYKCKARLITENSSEGISVRKMTGDHNHPDHSAEIKKHLNMITKETKTLKAKRSTTAMKANRKMNLNSIIAKAFDMSDYDSNSSCSSLSNDIPNLPERLEDMRQKYAMKGEKHVELAPPEHIDFVDSIECDFLENEHDPFNESNTDQFDSKLKSKILKKRGRKPKISLQESDDDDGESQSIITAKRGRKRKGESCDDNNDSDYNQNESKNKKSVKRVRKRSQNHPKLGEVEYDMDITKISQLRSAKGGTLLCVDGYIYHMKSEATRRNYWICIKNRDYSIKCKSFVTTNANSGDIKIIHVTNKHNHPVNENDIKRRLCNELTARGALPKKISKTNYFQNRTLEEIKADCSAILSLKDEDLMGIDSKRKMKLYAVSDGPPSLAVRMTLKALNIPYDLVNVDYISGEHMSESYEKMNPQKEIPVLDDDGFYLSESIAIMQYLCDKYAPSDRIYPNDLKTRALINHRLCFNMGFYYASISAHAMAPIFFDYQRNEMTLKKVNNALSVFEKYLKRLGTKYAAANHVTIADFALVSATLCMEAIDFDLSKYPLVKTWYDTFKEEYPQLWEIGNAGMQEIAEFEKNPPDLSHMNHPFHPTRTVKT